MYCIVFYFKIVLLGGTQDSRGKQVYYINVTYLTNNNTKVKCIYFSYCLLVAQIMMNVYFFLNMQNFF